MQDSARDKSQPARPREDEATDDPLRSQFHCYRNRKAGAGDGKKNHSSGLPSTSRNARLTKTFMGP